MRLALYLASGALLVLSAGFAVAALLLTGGDSAFADASHWIYAPWLVATVLSVAGTVAVVADDRATAVGLLGASAVAFVVTYDVWA